MALRETDISRSRSQCVGRSAVVAENRRSCSEHRRRSQRLATFHSSSQYRSAYDFKVPAQIDAYYDDVLAADAMQEQITPADPSTGGFEDTLEPSCMIAPANATSGPHRLFPPRRLVQVAKAFGADGVLGSLCANDFGSTTGRIIHAIGERLSAAPEH